MTVNKRANIPGNGSALISADSRRSYNMSCIRSKNTKPELAFRKELRAQGLVKYRLHPKNLPGCPDVYFPSKKIAIFINGCFWHMCPYCKRNIPKTNRAFWKNKLLGNALRDKQKKSLLRKMGVKPLSFWECQIEKNVGRLVAKVLNAIR